MFQALMGIFQLELLIVINILVIKINNFKVIINVKGKPGKVN